jgi:hypothetical protein
MVCDSAMTAIHFPVVVAAVIGVQTMMVDRPMNPTHPSVCHCPAISNLKIL